MAKSVAALGCLHDKLLLIESSQAVSLKTDL